MNVDINIYNIARTMVDRDQVRLWLERIGAGGYQLPSPEVTSDPALLVALAAKRCYLSFEPGLNPNVTKVRKDLIEYLDNILASGHGSVLEHAVYSYAIEGVSRVFTGEMNRHRAGWAISEGSMRYIRYDAIPWWMPTCLQPLPKDEGEAWTMAERDLEQRKKLTRALFQRAFAQMEENYALFLRIWDMDSRDHNFHYKKRVTSCGRRIIGMGVATGGVWTGNLRALRHVIALRANEEAAEEEIYHVFCLIAEDMMKREPSLFGDFSVVKGSFVPKYPKV